LRWLLGAPALAVVLEWVRSWAFSGFPWLSPGYSQIDGPLGGLAPLGGVFAVGWGVWLSAGLLCMVLGQGARNRWLALAGLVVLWGSAWVLKGVDWTHPEGPPLAVSLIQGNIAQDDKFQPENLEQTLSLYARLSVQEQDRDLIVWPETAIPLFVRDVEEPFLGPLAERARQTDTDYLIGAPDGDWEQGVFYNGVVAIGGERGFYRKQRLLPFGEYLPLRWLFGFFHELVQIPMADFTPGSVDQPLLRVQGLPVGVSICFEAVFGHEIIRALPQARLLVNVSNDAWFGDSLAPHQHLEIARMRALETGRAMARATNTGISALVDHRGRITDRSQMFEIQVLRGEVQPRVGMTPYAVLGDWPVVGTALGLLLIGLIVAGGQIRWYQSKSP
ncbi:MAG: apolipoprotein N-acyltransferase, partial [Candidatus Competibacteraceae bacterium]|nr:apolipoprotein N-acyltransferase [Candidatus Competibacteraceae bacterium]